MIRDGPCKMSSSATAPPTLGVRSEGLHTTRECFNLCIAQEGTLESLPVSSNTHANERQPKTLLQCNTLPICGSYLESYHLAPPRIRTMADVGCGISAANTSEAECNTCNSETCIVSQRVCSYPCLSTQVALELVCPEEQRSRAE